MHALQLAEIANWTAFNADKLIFGTTPLTAVSCNDYWSQSKVRQNRWMTALKLFEQDVKCEDQSHDPWPAIEIVTQEIFLSEILTRVWSAALVSHDEYHATDELGSVAHSIHIGHVEAKNRSMRLLLEDRSVSPDVFDRLNALRRKVERWTDLLLGQLPNVESAACFAFQSNRVRDFHEDKHGNNGQFSKTRKLLYSASMSEDLIRVTGRYAANPEINRRIAGGLLACFPADRFDSYGLPKSIQLVWLEKASDDTQLLMDDLAALDHTVVSQSLDDVIERG